MRLAVTGGAGFLGYHLCGGLSAKFEEISVLDIAPIDPKEYPTNVKYFRIDVRNPDQLKEAFKNVDLVVHAAAALPLWKKKDIYDINIEGTKNVLGAARINNIKRVVFISSTAVYGIPKRHPIYEDDPLTGVGPYGESKIAAEKLCEDYRKKGMVVPVIRPKTFIGTGRLGVFQILYDWVENGKRIPVIGNGKNRYQLLEVDDLVAAVYLTLSESAEKANQTFNVGAQTFKTVLEDLSAMCEFAKTGATVMSTPAFIVKPMLAFFEKIKLSPLYKWVYGTADKDSFVSIDKIKQTLNWQPRYSNAEALITSYKWYLEHKGELSHSGITHRVGWKQGVLGFFKKFL
jgi:nucleoside-diphosphate-sugar epimerase